MTYGFEGLFSLIYTALRPAMLPTIANTPYITMSHATIVDPTGVPDRMEMIIPISVQRTDRIAEQIVTLLKLLNTLIEDIAGKMTSADMRSDPTRFIARTIIVAMMIAMMML